MKKVQQIKEPEIRSYYQSKVKKDNPPMVWNYLEPQKWTDHTFMRTLNSLEALGVVTPERGWQIFCLYESGEPHPFQLLEPKHYVQDRRGKRGKLF